MKTILSAIFTVALVSVLVGAGTFAYYADTETSSDNTFTSGTMDLYMEDGGPDISSEWVMVNMQPGVSSESGKLNLWNIGTVEADHVEIYFTTICKDLALLNGQNEESDTLDGAEDMDKYLRLTSMKYEENTGVVHKIVWQADYGSGNVDEWDPNYIDDYNGNGYIDLHDLNGVKFDDLPAPPANGDKLANDDHEFSFDVKFDISAPNDFQGDQCILTIDFILNQDSTQ